MRTAAIGRGMSCASTPHSTAPSARSNRRGQPAGAGKVRSVFVTSASATTLAVSAAAHHRETPPNMSAAASEHFKFDWKATAGLVALVVFCALVFVKGLGVPMPLVGTWLQPLTILTPRFFRITAEVEF